MLLEIVNMQLFVNSGVIYKNVENKTTSIFINCQNIVK